MPGAEGNRVRDLLAEGARLLELGRSNEAADVFGRILLHNSDHVAARAGLDRARAASREDERLMDSRIEAAESAIGCGQLEEARGLLENAGGAHPDRVLALLDRLDARAGAIDAVASHAPGRGGDDSRSASSRVNPRRRLFVAVWGFVFLASSLAIAGTWDALMGELTRTPLPATHVAPQTAPLPQPVAGDRALAQARRQIEGGDLKAAIATLDAIAPEDPAYPFAHRLRREAEQIRIQRRYGE